jgi:hypothetical protein
VTGFIVILDDEGVNTKQAEAIDGKNFRDLLGSQSSIWTPRAHMSTIFE